MGNSHNKFAGATPVTRTIDLIADDDRPLAKATVVEDQPTGQFVLQLDYSVVGENIIDNEGYINIRWTKKDLQRMINMLELAEGIKK